MTKEKKKTSDKKSKKTGIKIAIAVAVCAVLLFLLFLDSIAQAVFGYETVEWNGVFNYTTTNWFYNTKSYAVFTCDKYDGYTVTLPATEEGDPNPNGFYREGSGTSTNLKVVGDELVPYLRDVLGWTKLKK